jgi:hypothetical protein
MAITKIQSESLNLSDNYDFTGTVTGAGGVNTPAFLAFRSGANQTISASTETVVQFNSENFLVKLFLLIQKHYYNLIQKLLIVIVVMTIVVVIINFNQM